VKVAAQIADVFGAVTDIGSVAPHTVEGEISHGSRVPPNLVADRADTNLDYGAFADLHVFEGFKDAVFIYRRDGRCIAPENSIHSWLLRALHLHSTRNL